MAARTMISKTSPLMVRLDRTSKATLLRASQLRQISVSDYVRQVTVSQARRETISADHRVLALSPDEQLQFWHSLNAPVKLTPRQKKLAAIMRGDAK